MTLSKCSLHVCTGRCFGQFCGDGLCQTHFSWCSMHCDTVRKLQQAMPESLAKRRDRCAKCMLLARMVWRPAFWPAGQQQCQNFAGACTMYQHTEWKHHRTAQMALLHLRQANVLLADGSSCCNLLLCSMQAQLLLLRGVPGRDSTL